MSRAELKSHNRRKYREALLAGGCFALGALPTSAAIIFLANMNKPLRWLILTSTIAAFISGTILGRIIFGGGRRPTFWRGAGVGALIVVMAQPLAWYLLFLILYFSGETDTFPATTVHPLGGLWASLPFASASLLLFGWVTVPVGGAIGGGLGYAAGKEWDKSAGSQGLIHTADYSGIDHVLYAWAQRHGLQIFVKSDHLDVRSIPVAGGSGRSYQIWVDAPDERKEIHIHAWDYKRMRADVMSSSHDLGEKLEQIYATVMSWDASQ